MNYYFLIVSLFCLYFTGCNKSSELSQTEQSSANESEIASKDVDIVWGEDGNSVLLKQIGFLEKNIIFGRLPT